MTITAQRLLGQRSPWLVATGIGAGVGADVAFDPQHRHVPMCPFKAATGWDCPLCGGLRATDQLAHGHLGPAFHDNALLVLALPLIAWAWTYALIQFRAGRARGQLPRWAATAGVVLFVGFAVLRNLPWMKALRPI
jgi:hypothetical protein